MRTLFLIILSFLFIDCYSQNDTTNLIDDSVFIFPEEMPSFPGGENALREFINTNSKYPLSKRRNCKGKVYIYVVINGEGNVEQVEVKKSVNPILDAEAVRIIKSMPQWKPGKFRGKPFKVAYTIPINFKLDTNNRY